MMSMLIKNIDNKIRPLQSFDTLKLEKSTNTIISGTQRSLAALEKEQLSAESALRSVEINNPDYFLHAPSFALVLKTESIDGAT